jgi:two-component system, chemotaxis family, protein-glutamate methylesterase/glutaminase
MRVLVVDDTIAYRTIVSNILAEIPGVEVVGTASNGLLALSKIKSLKPDLLTLDIEMPEMNGLDVLEVIKRDSLNVGAIMVSSLTKRGGELTIRALELGAFDFITKPDAGSMQSNAEQIKKALGQLIKAYAEQREIHALLRGTANPQPRNAAHKEATEPVIARKGSTTVAGNAMRAEAVGIGVSTGGPNALTSMLPMLPGDVNVPILIVQHMPPLFTQSLANSLSAKCALKIKEAENGEPLLPNTVYIAPGGKQMKITLGTDARTKIIHVTNDPPENYCKPSVDYLFRSLAHHYLGRATGVIMTGMGNDGVLGLRLMKRNHCTVIAQDQTSCVVFGMPKEAIDAGVVDIVAPLDMLAAEIVRTIR